MVAEYPQACENNGLVGKVIFSKRSYFLTSSDSQAYALNHSASSCAALASPMCNTVSALPPYSCSRTLKQGFFSCAATAVANAQFLVQVLVFACAFMLPKLAKVFPATTRAAIDGASTVSAAAVASSSSVLAQAAQITSTASADPAGLSPAAAEHSMSGASTVNNTADAYLEMAVMGQVRYDVENPLNSV